MYVGHGGGWLTEGVFGIRWRIRDSHGGCEGQWNGDNSRHTLAKSFASSLLPFAKLMLSDLHPRMQAAAPLSRATLRCPPMQCEEGATLPVSGIDAGSPGSGRPMVLDDREEADCADKQIGGGVRVSEPERLSSGACERLTRCGGGTIKVDSLGADGHGDGDLVEGLRQHRGLAGTSIQSCSATFPHLHQPDQTPASTRIALSTCRSKHLQPSSLGGCWISTPQPNRSPNMAPFPIRRATAPQTPSSPTDRRTPSPSQPARPLRQKRWTP